MGKRLITFTGPQEAWLLAEAARLDIGVSELVRRIIDRERGANMQGGYIRIKEGRPPHSTNPDDLEIVEK